MYFPVYNVFREDVVTNGDDRDNMLKNAPAEKDGTYKVPRDGRIGGTQMKITESDSSRRLAKRSKRKRLQLQKL